MCNKPALTQHHQFSSGKQDFQNHLTQLLQDEGIVCLTIELMLNTALIVLC